MEAKLEVPAMGTAFRDRSSYSNMRGVGYLPVTGGLFLGDEAAALLAATEVSDHPGPAQHGARPVPLSDRAARLGGAAAARMAAVFRWNSMAPARTRSRSMASASSIG